MRKHITTENVKHVSLTEDRVESIRLHNECAAQFLDDRRENSRRCKVEEQRSK